MNDYEKTIEVLQNRVRELEQLIRPVNGVAELTKWQPKRGAYYIGSDGTTYNYANSVDKRRMFGHERQTEEQIKLASVEMRRFNRLLALRDELCGNEILSCWFSPDDRNYYVYFAHIKDKWDVTSDGTNESITPYFTSLKSARLACNMLNSGEVEL